jgi:hypothetical protein
MPNYFYHYHIYMNKDTKIPAHIFYLLYWNFFKIAFLRVVIIKYFGNPHC